MKRKKNGFGAKRETPCQLLFQLNWLTGSMVLQEIGILLNDLERNSSGGNGEKQNEDAESVMARLYLSGKVRVVRKKTKKCKSTCSCRHHIFIRIRKYSLVFAWYYATKAATVQTAKERQRDRSFQRQT